MIYLSDAGIFLFKIGPFYALYKILTITSVDLLVETVSSVSMKIYFIPLLVRLEIPVLRPDYLMVTVALPHSGTLYLKSTIIPSFTIMSQPIIIS